MSRKKVVRECQLSSAQSALWFLHQCYPSVGLYNVEFSWCIPEDIDLEKLQASIHYLTDRHEMVRSTFTVKDGIPVRQEWDRWDHALEVREVGAIDNQTLSRQYIDAETHVPFDLSAAPPKRFILFRRTGFKPVLTIIMNHIIMDLASIMLWMNELRAVYSALVRDLPPDLPPLEVNFDDYLQRQEEYLLSDQAGKDEHFWLTRLADAGQGLDFPTDYPRRNLNEFDTGYETGMVSRDLSDGLLSLASSLKLSPYEAFLACYFVFLYKYTGQTDITIGTPTAGRKPDHYKIYAYCVNPIVLQASINPELGVGEQLQQVAASIKECLRHRNYPSALLANQLALDRSEGSGALFQNSFVWQSANSFFNRKESIVSWTPEGKRYWDMKALGVWERLPRHQQIDELDLTFKIYKLNEGFHWGIEYNRELFSRETILNLYEYFETLLCSILVNPEKKVGELSILDSERARLLIEHGRGPRVNNIRQKSFPELFTAIAHINGGQEAVFCEGDSLSYAELNSAANRLAHKLINMGVQPGTRVGVALDKSTDLMVAVLAVMKSGAVYLPLDPTYPQERLRYIAADAGLSVLIGSSELPLQFTNAVVVPPPSQDGLSSFADTDPPITVNGDDVVYIIYTSGSTGRPKGVELRHAGLMAMIEAQHEVFALNTEDRVLQFASINFDASVFEMVLALASGASLYLAPKASLLGDDLADFLAQQEITCSVLPPVVLAAMSHRELPALKTLMTAGDNCTQEIVNQWGKDRAFYNAYGPTEATVWSTIARLKPGERITIGQAIPNSDTCILDPALNPVPIGVPGELYIGGLALAKGYLNRGDLTEERFIPNPFEAGERLYKTGDLVRYLPDGNIEFLGRLDHQVKIRGFRIELGEVTETILKHDSVHDALVMARDDMPGASKENPMLVAYVVKDAEKSLEIEELRNHLREQLPDYMVPAAFAILDAFPLTPNNKVDRKALPRPVTSSTGANIQEPRNQIERILAEIWESCLGVTQVSINANFFDLGGHSLLVAKVYNKLPDNFREKARLVDLFKYPTIRSLAHFLQSDVEEDEYFLEQDNHAERLRLRRRLMESLSGVKVAIVGMSGRFPGADSVEEMWDNVCQGKETITFFTPEQLRRAGVSEDTIKQPNYVPAKGMLDSISGFDAPFFNFTPREAQITDPQQRLFLECAWEALEDAGCVPERFGGPIGVYAGIGMNQYLMTNLSSHPELLAAIGDYPLMIGNDKDFLCTRVSYKLNLNGPAMVLQTACSSSLVAVHTACQALLNEECDAALAGGVSFNRLGKEGYFYHEGMIMSPDGHCRAFDADAKGTVQGQGAGVVLLKRLDDAMKNNDHIYAVIVGSATNNDGSHKSGYTAPSVEGQAKVINMALASANLNPSKIGYVEAHGTGTPLGDPIEIEALKQAFQREDIPPASCAIGSLKTNMGHLDAASGVAGLIKAAKAVETRQLPPSLHFQKPNPKIDFKKTPFYVNTQLTPWNPEGHICFAGVSSFGIGGTNAHVVLSEAPNETQAESARPWRLVTLSARTPKELEAMTERFVAHIKTHHRQSFANICYTLHVGRAVFPFRRYLVCRNRDEAISELTELNPQRVNTTHYQGTPQKIAFMFSGQGSQYINMGKHLYRVEITFRETVDQCRNLIKQRFVHLYEELSEEDHSAQTDKLHQTYVTQPSLFIFEYALAKVLMEWGIQPDYMIGHSIGEYVAACIAGVFTLEQALELVTIRGHLIQELESGEMLSVNLPEKEAVKYTNEGVSLAVVNGESRCVLSGDSHAIRQLHDVLSGQGIDNRILHTSHAFHSHMMEPILERFRAYVERREPQPPKKPFVSSLTGLWISDAQATSAKYWADHLRYSVQFHRGMQTLFNGRQKDDDNERLICLEVGPGKVLKTLANQHPAKGADDLILATTRHAYEQVSDTQYLLNVIGKLWEQGVDIDWDAFHSARQRYRVPLPTYPFNRKTYWVRPKARAEVEASVAPLSNDAVETPEMEDSESLSLARNKPRDSVEETIWKLWCQTLGRDDIDIYDNYFDLGGDSLLAVGIMDKLKGRFNLPLATHLLISRPSVAELAEYIKSQVVQPLAEGAEADETSGNSSIASPLVVIQPGDPEFSPLAMVHPIGGEVFYYRDLAIHLGREQPVYAFQAPGLMDNGEPLNSVPALAELYLAELKRSGVEPPYLLGGSSFGGLVAFEMAQQAMAAGEAVQLVVMIDTPAPHEMPKNLNDSAAILEYLLAGDLKLDSKKLRLLSEQDQVDYVLEEARLQGKGEVLPPHLGVSLFRTWMAHQQATFSYEPKFLDCDVLYFRHSEPQEHFPALPHVAWQALTEEDRLTVHRAPGNHVSMNYPPHVQFLARKLKERLRELRHKSLFFSAVKRATDGLMAFHNQDSAGH